MNDDTESLFRSAVKAHDRGQGDAALELYVQVLQRNPQHVDALYRLAMLASQAGRPDESAPLLEKAVELAPTNGEYHFRLGQAHDRLGNAKSAITAFEHAIEILPSNVEAMIRLGTLYVQCQRRDDALMLFQRALVVAPQLRRWAKDANVPSEFRDGIGVALRELAGKFASFLDECLQTVRANHPGEDLSRLEAGLRTLGGGARNVEPGGNERRPALLNFPDLPDQPWFEREQFDWIERVESETPVIVDELNQLLARQAEFKPYCSESDSANAVSAAGTDFSSLAGSMSWNALHLYQNSTRSDANCGQCPKTVELMDSLPMPRIRHHSPEVFFSCLQPGGHIIPHHGLMNVRLTVHLGLVIPENCGIRAGREVHHWQPGRVLLFDDSYEHEAWNKSDSDRVVLIFEAWNPHVSAAERDGIEEIFRLRRDWLDQFEVYRPA